jgi:phage terminase large subunit
MAVLVNENYLQIRKAYRAGKAAAVLEGGSRSGKTRGCVRFITWLATVEKYNGTLNIVRETYNSFKTTLYDDFTEELKLIPQIENPFIKNKDVAQFKFFDLKINFLGCDNISAKFGVKGMTYYNEFLDIPLHVYNQLNTRAVDFWFADYNPKFENHWVYDKVIKRPDVHFYHSTFRDNPFIPKENLKTILSYDPSVPENVLNGTADEYMWQVYGLGLKAAPEGLFFVEGVDWSIVDEIPEKKLEKLTGLDFGYNPDPTAICDVYYNQQEAYLDEVLYEINLVNANQINSISTRLTEKGYKKGADIIICDCAEPKSIQELRYDNWLALPCKKGSDSILYGIKRMKSRKLYVTRRSVNLINELRTYKRFRDPITGEYLDKPDPKIRAKHEIDSARYVFLSDFLEG